MIFLFSGKAHPNDTISHELIKRIFEMTRRPGFEGRVIFLQNYDKMLPTCLFMCGYMAEQS